MKKIIIPLTKTDCGEIFSGEVIIEKTVIIDIMIEPIGSQLLSIIANFLIEKFKNKTIRHIMMAKKIFFRLSKQQYLGTRKIMIDTFFDTITTHIKNNVYA